MVKEKEDEWDTKRKEEEDAGQRGGVERNRRGGKMSKSRVRAVLTWYWSQSMGKDETAVLGATTGVITCAVAGAGAFATEGRAVTNKP